MRTNPLAECGDVDEVVRLNRKEIYERLENATIHGGDRKSKLPQIAQSNRNSFGLIPSFTQDTSHKTGISNTAIEQSIKRATAFTAATVQAEHPPKPPVVIRRAATVQAEHPPKPPVDTWVAAAVQAGDLPK